MRRSWTRRSSPRRAASVVEVDHPVDVLEDHRVVGHHHDRPVAGAAGEGGEQPAAGVGVEAGRGLVEQQHPAVEQQGPGQRDPLPLAAGQAAAPLADPGVVALRQPLDERVRVGLHRGQPHLAERGVGAGEGDVVADAGVQHAAAPAGRSRRRSRTERAVWSATSWPSISTVPRSGSSCRASSRATVDLPEPLAPTIATRSPGGHLEVDVGERRRAGPGIGVRSPRAGRRHRRRPAARWRRAGRGRRARRAARRSARRPAVAENRLGHQVGELADRAVALHEQGEEGQQAAEGEPVGGQRPDAEADDEEHADQLGEVDQRQEERPHPAAGELGAGDGACSAGGSRRPPRPRGRRPARARRWRGSPR